MKTIINDKLLETLLGHYETSDLKVKFITNNNRAFSDVSIWDIYISSKWQDKICVKIYKRSSFSDIQQRVYNEFHSSNKYRALFDCDTDFQIVENIGLISDDITIVSKYVDGVDLYDYIKRFPREQCLENLFYKCGLFMKNFHLQKQYESSFDFEKLIEYVDIRLKKLCENDGRKFVLSDRESVLRKLIQLSSKYIKNNKMTYCGIHGDFIPPNIRVKPNGKLCLLDFSNFRSSLPYDEIGYFLAFMWCQDLKFPRSATFSSLIIKRFFSGYGPSIDQELLSLFYLKHLINQAWGTLKIIKKNEDVVIKSMLLKIRYEKMLAYISTMADDNTA